MTSIALNINTIVVIIKCVNVLFSILYFFRTFVYLVDSEYNINDVAVENPKNTACSDNIVNNPPSNKFNNINIHILFLIKFFIFFIYTHYSL